MRKLLTKFRYLIEYYFFMFFIKLCRLFPLDIAASICSWLCRIFGPLLNVSQIVRKNMVNTKVAVTIKDVDVLLDGLWDNYGRFIAEFAHIESLTPKVLMSRCKVINADKVQGYLNKRKPIIIVTGHFANWELGLRALHEILPEDEHFAFIYRKANNPYVNEKIIETRFNKLERIEAFEKGRNGVRALFDAIKSKKNLILLADQKMNNGIKVPFMGYDAMTSKLAARAAIEEGYMLIPLQIIRTDGSRFELVFHPPIEVEKKADYAENIYNLSLKINQKFEKWIYQHPEQWFWFHQRWNF